MRSQHYILAVVGILLAACSPRVRPADPNTDVVFVPLSEEPKRYRSAERVVIGMSRQQVDAIMGPSVETCWIYPAGNVSQRVCFRGGKVTVIARTEHVPGTDHALIDATFATDDASTSSSVPPGKLAIGASIEEVGRLLGPPPMTREQYNVGTGYRATFTDGRLTEFQDIPVPPAHGISGTRPGARP